MAGSKAAKPFDVAEALASSLAINHRITRYLIENLSDDAWRAEPPNGKGRTVAAIAAHIHNVRGMWLKAAGKDIAIPEKLDRSTVTRKEALDALEESFVSMSELIGKALERDGRIKGFRPDVAGFVGYLIAHEAHHRGQMTMLARQCGFPVSQSVMFGMWEWGKR